MNCWEMNCWDLASTLESFLTLSLAPAGKSKGNVLGNMTRVGPASRAGISLRDLGMFVKRHKNQLRDYMVTGPGARFSKLPVITGSGKLFCFPFQMGVSKLLKIIL